MTAGCEQECPTRRSALKLTAAAGAAALLAGCSVYGGSADEALSGQIDPGPVNSDGSAEPSADPSAEPSAESEADPSADPEVDPSADPEAEPSAEAKPAGVVLASTSQIPVGGGKIFAKRGVVVTQPTAGTFVAFSTACTHQGCAVEKVADGTIDCLCHGSKFSVTDGSVTDGPARRPLARRKIAVDGDSVTLV